MGIRFKSHPHSNLKSFHRKDEYIFLKFSLIPECDINGFEQFHCPWGEMVLSHNTKDNFACLVCCGGCTKMEENKAKLQVSVIESHARRRKGEKKGCSVCVVTVSHTVQNHRMCINASIKIRKLICQIQSQVCPQYSLLWDHRHPNAQY